MHHRSNYSIKRETTASPIDIWTKETETPNSWRVHGWIVEAVGGAESQMYQNMIIGSWYSMTGKKKFIPFLQRPRQEDLTVLKKLIEEGHSQGKVVITI
ncbi:hypothetical protein E1I69_21815 [Bacillus timonensis]|uniref:Uncharacterized protein n=1 Tax=Bacillus timonensis TaxID=1033734 RepID=A0A4S3PLN0_9BACI|nr:hypothetical protein [Bacillus timonensis]THE09562.1 hypothetical protein E1I69_21815 [Bacillus timonensis]